LSSSLSSSMVITSAAETSHVQSGIRVKGEKGLKT